MPRINPEGQLTRAERLATVIAIAGAVLVHLVVLLGWGRLSRWTQEEEKKERLMVIRRVRDLTPPPPDQVPTPPRQRLAPTGAEGGAPSGEKAAPPPAAAPKVKEQGPEPPEPEPERDLSPAMEQELKQEKPEEARATEQGDNSVSVVTDLPAASFIIDGASQHRGSGTYWVRKGAQPGSYTVTFNPVAGFATPPAQTKDLVAKGQIVFVGKYRRSTELVVESNMPNAQVTVHRPDNRPIDLSRPGRTFVDDLPLGVYTAVFKDLPPLITPAPVSQNLVAGGKLSFYGEYRDAPGGRGGGSGRDGAGSGSGGSGTGGSGSGSGAGGRGTGRGRGGAGAEEGGLDRRVQMTVTGYKGVVGEQPVDISENFPQIDYPERTIRKSDFQKGWCQVELSLRVDAGGEITSIEVQRPSPRERDKFQDLIQTVERAVRGWDYDTVWPEVIVDVRFYVE